MLSFLGTLLLWAIASFGHAALLVFGLNRAYARPWPHRVLGSLRLLTGLLVLGGPVLFALCPPLRLVPVTLEPTPARLTALTPYIVLCWASALVTGIDLIIRVRRRPPAVLVSSYCKTVDVAAELGYKPLGRGKHRLVAGLPGNEVFQVDFTEKTFLVRDLPTAWEGLTILHISDVHFLGSPDREFYRRTFDRCREWNPDLLALTGDYVDKDQLRRWIIPLFGRLRWRLAAFAVLGNHDCWHDPALIRRRLRKLRIDVLGNSWREIDLLGEKLVVIGHEGPWIRPEPDLTGCPPDHFRLCLSHTPDNIQWARRNNVGLMLSGHNHGGQIRVPLAGSIFVPSRYGRRYDCGTFDEPPTLLHVSRGLAGKQPLRYNCRPEVTLLTLRRDDGVTSSKRE